MARVPVAWRWLMLAGAALLVLIAIIIATRPTVSRRPPPGTAVFAVGGQVALRFVRSTGSVHVRAGPDGQVSITQNRSGFTGAIGVRYRHTGNVITVTVSVQNGLPLATWVDFGVVVPRDASVSVATGAGTLTAAGITGDLALRDASGSIWAARDSGALALRTVSGSVNTSQVSGQVQAITGNGTITTISTRLRGRSLMRAQNGTINFHGSLDPGCHAVFTNTGGAIGITLPGRSSVGASVLVDARAATGSINSEFPSVHVAQDPPGRSAHGRIGQGAPARLRIQTMSGSITLSHETSPPRRPNARR